MSWSWNIFWFPFGIVRAFIQIWYVIWPPLLCDFMSFSLKRWIFSRQSPRPFSRQDPFRRLRDIHRKLIRKTNQKTIPSICRTGHEISMFAWTQVGCTTCWCGPTFSTSWCWRIPLPPELTINYFITLIKRIWLCGRNPQPISCGFSRCHYTNSTGSAIKSFIVMSRIMLVRIILPKKVIKSFNFYV